MLPTRLPMPWGISAVKKPLTHHASAISHEKPMRSIWEGIHRNPKAKPWSPHTSAYTMGASHTGIRLGRSMTIPHRIVHTYR